MSTAPGTDPIPRTFKQRMLLWLWNAMNAVIGGMAGAGAGVGIGAITGAASFTNRQFWSMVCGSGIVALFNYIRSNRLPDLFVSQGE